MRKRANLATENTGKAIAKGAQDLIRAAERLYARHGVEDVSLRQIVTEAGQSNSYAIQHHFGDKDGLIRAILDTRLPQLNAMRAARLQKLRAQGKPNLRALIEALYMPIADFTDETGRHVYAHFLLRQGWKRTTEMWARESGLVSASFAIQDALRALLPRLAENAFQERLELVSVLFLYAVTRMDEMGDAGASPAAQKQYLTQALDMCAGAMAAV